jgi:Rad3-related DNA helicase
MDYKEFPSTFPADNRKVVLRPVANLVYKEMENEVPKVVNAVRGILESHRGEKGLIHTVSYKLAAAIMGIGDARLVSHNGGDKIDVLERFKESSEPLVLVSPSSERGISLNEDLCRFIIWVKAPFLSLADKMVSARIYKSAVGNLWYASDAVMTIVQGCGRGVRSRNDRCVSYLLDEQIIKLLTKNPTLAPLWFREAVVYGN